MSARMYHACGYFRYPICKTVNILLGGLGQLGTSRPFLALGLPQECVHCVMFYLERHLYALLGDWDNLVPVALLSARVTSGMCALCHVLSGKTLVCIAWGLGQLGTSRPS